MTLTDRQRFVACVLGEPLDRPRYWLSWPPWGSTWRRWREDAARQPGAGEFPFPLEIETSSEFEGAFRAPFAPDQTPLPVPINTGPCPRIQETVLEETDEFVVHVDSWGIKRRDFRRRTSMSEFVEFPVMDRADWERYRDERLDPDHPDRLAGNWREQCAKWTAMGYPIQLGQFPDAGVFGPLRWLLGPEEGLIAFHTMPDLVHEIMDHITTVYLAVFEKVVREFRVDVIHFWEDMCYRNGPLISPKHWEEFIGPNYRRVKAFARKHGIPVVSVDTDGDPDLIAGPMINAGVNFLNPMEVAAGCDVNEWRRKYPDLALMGGIDKRALAHGREAIDSELARVAPALGEGRYIPALDHLIPDDGSWDDYCYYATALKKLVGKP